MFVSPAAYYTQDGGAVPSSVRERPDPSADGPQPPPRAFRLAQLNGNQKISAHALTPSRIVQSEDSVLPERPIVDEKKE